MIIIDLRVEADPSLLGKENQTDHRVKEVKAGNY
jgi:hypothetical protein